MRVKPYYLNVLIRSLLALLKERFSLLAFYIVILLPLELIRKKNLREAIRAYFTEIDTIVNDIFIRKDYGQLAEYIPQNGVIIDLGAHIGLYTVWLSRRLKKEESMIIAIEPVSWNYFRLRLNLILHRLSNIVIPLRIAISDYRGHIQMYIPRTSYIRGSIIRNHVERLGHKGYTVDVVPTMTLDDILKHFSRVRMLKVDIEGGELAVLRASKLLGATVERLIVEVHKTVCSPKDVIELLIQRGFSIEKIVDKSSDVIIYARKSLN